MRIYHNRLNIDHSCLCPEQRKRGTIQESFPRLLEGVGSECTGGIRERLSERSSRDVSGEFQRNQRVSDKLFKILRETLISQVDTITSISTILKSFDFHVFTQLKNMFDEQIEIEIVKSACSSRNRHIPPRYGTTSLHLA